MQKPEPKDRTNDVQLNVRIPAAVKRHLRHAAFDGGVPLRHLVGEILAEWVELTVGRTGGVRTDATDPSEP